MILNGLECPELSSPAVALSAINVRVVGGVC